MKRIVKIAFVAVLATLFLSSQAGAQEKKEQQKIKIVIADNGGTKVVIDTTFAGSTTPDSITLKDGNVIYIKSGNCNKIGSDMADCKAKKVFVTVTDDEKGDKKIRKEITVIAGDSANSDKKEDGKKFIVMSDGNATNETDKSSYVIAKNGIVVTIEGGTEEQVKELASVIESKLGVKKDNKTGKK